MTIAHRGGLAGDGELNGTTKAAALVSLPGGFGHVGGPYQWVMVKACTKLSRYWGSVASIDAPAPCVLADTPQFLAETPWIRCQVFSSR